jgi:hypothetical protein
MKRIFLFLILVLSFDLTNAQTYESIKNQIILNLKQAKTDIDKAMANAKFASRAEAYIIKTTIYSQLSIDEAVKNTLAGDDLAKEAEAAFKKYREMDPSLSLLSDPIYKSGPINLYSNFYSSGYTDYASNKWNTGFEKLKKAVEFSDLLIEKKILTAAIDTNVLILAGITAENNNLKDDAARYYGRLADKKITGDGFESVYRFLVNYYFVNKDFSSFEKYKSTGKELYPKSDYFTFDKIDFIVGLETTFDGKIKAIEDALAADPGNFKANEALGEIIYDTLNPHDKISAWPSDAEELEKKMITAFNRAAILNPDFENPYIYLGDHFINKAAKVDNERTAFAADLKTKLKPGTTASKEDIAKREALDKKYAEALELAIQPYEKAVALFAKKEKLKARETQQYKKIAGYLGEIYGFKKERAKGKPADLAKFTAEEKKWNDLYEHL